jgi:hypothetical protein
MTNYTPGPWALDRDEPEAWNIHVVQANDRDMRICFMTSDGPSEANARLITAAPDLLQALDDLLCVIATDELIPESVSYMRHARAAIAKATGE